MHRLDPFAMPPTDAVAVGTGRLTLDVIVRTGNGPTWLRSQAGGTCGNVLANLAYLGWHCYPLTDLGEDDPGRRFAADLARWGVHLDLIRHAPDQETPVIVHHIHQTEHGAQHRFSSRCPFCARRLRYYEPVPLAAVEQRLPRIPTPHVFFFDRDSEGALRLARHVANQGALVVFEPNYAGPETRFAEALAVTHLLKFAADKLPGLADQPLPGPALVIETQGAAGLRYLDRRRPGASWQHLSAVTVPVVRDAAGAGDWCTAGLIHQVGWLGLAGFLSLPAEELRAALRFGQALAAWNCAFEGARGGIYAVERERFVHDVRALLAGQTIDPAENASPASLDDAGAFCRGCGGRPEGQ